MAGEVPELRQTINVGNSHGIHCVPEFFGGDSNRVCTMKTREGNCENESDDRLPLEGQCIQATRGINVVTTSVTGWRNSRESKM